MSLTETITTTMAPATTSNMASHPASTSTSNSSSTGTHSLLLGSLQPGNTAPMTPSKAKKQAQAQRTRLVALSKHLMTRLQYANFKVEHGWTKQSLSEVENLYYRQNEGASTGAGASGVARKSASTSPNGAGTKAPATPGASSSASVSSRLFKEAALKKSEVEGGDVFGGYGLTTPPASAGTVPGAHTSYFSGKRARTPISPPSAGTASSSKHSEASGTTKRSPNSGLNGSAGNSASRTAQPALHNKASNGVTSYADFWSRVGSSSAAGAALSASRSVSPSKKRSAENMEGNEAAKAASSTEQDSAPATASATGAAPASPNKRVRMEASAERGSLASTNTNTSPAKVALSERGPSFASSTRR